ncbi:MAG TPA: 4-hydroxy-tetrahydrodipicolinate reductase [Polyangiaceae bacterium]
MRLAVVGASGRMGRAVVRLAHGQGVEIVCAVGSTDIGRDVGELAGVGAFGTCVVDGLAGIEHARADVVVDFSAPGATLALAPIAMAAGSAVVSGTTGLGDEAREALDRAAARVPVLWEPNMSLGVHVLTELVSRASSALADWDAEIVETHHRAKKDAPSGTALRLAESMGRAQMGMHSLRGGDVVGDHAVHFLGGGERLELVHRATNRDVFAHGALRAARWIVGRPPGRYALRDVLG